MSRKRLGKGLQALIPEIDETPLTEAIEMEITQIEINPHQPRKTFDEEKLLELTRSIEQHGILQPIIVRPKGAAYELVAGERRLRAAKNAGLKQVPVVIKTLSDREMMEIALIENLQREDLNPLEEAEAYQRLMEEFSYTQEQLAERVGKSRSAVANTMRLVALHHEVRQEIVNGNLTEGHARAILALPLEKQPEAARKVIALGLSVRETERLAGQVQKKAVRSPKKKAFRDDYIIALEERLRDKCGTAVSVRMSNKGRGKIEVHFYNLEELERICEALL
ncbi:MAG: ParB/RepB/Spo0J family partition protein [Dethiobacteraceae bacterium]|jgi:ParB family chromosome partitioning protein|nr:ParB/RepB/Spo0J family partition protein [Bacillota bacterium]